MIMLFARRATAGVPAAAGLPATAAFAGAVAGFLCAALVAMPAAAQTARAAEPAQAERQMVVAANPHASEAGIRILRAGGSAVDAAIAVQLVLSLVEPQSSGVGGGAFMLHFAAPDSAGAAPRITAYEGRETAPAAATEDMFLDEAGDPESFFAVGFGGLAVGVPGVMRMLEDAHREHGRLPWAELFDPAIELAERGFEVSPRLHFLLDRFKNVAVAEQFSAHYFDADGEPHPVGYRLENPEYADTLRLLAREGAEAMYSGSLAEAIVAEVRDNEVRPGRLTLEDLEAYRAHRADPMCTPYRRWRVCGPRLPSSGGIAVQQILGIVARLDPPALETDAASAVHLVAEASRLAFADRNRYLADPEFVDVPVDGLLSPEYLDARAALVDRERAMEQAEPGTPAAPQAAALEHASSPPSDVKSTSHLSIVDRWGDAVSMTTSVQSAFGSQLMVGGFILNNQLTDFTYVPVIDGRPVANRAQPGKRPLSSMSPTFVLDDDERLRMVIGSPGGTRIINYVAQSILNVLDWDMNIQEAVAAPHFVAQHELLELEQDTDLTALADALEALGHRVAPRSLNSGLHGITIDYGESGRTLRGGVDPRREGAALGD